MSEPKPCQGCGYVIRCKCVPVRYADNLTNLTDEGLRDLLLAWDENIDNFYAFVPEDAMKSLIELFKQVRDAAKKEERDEHKRTHRCEPSHILKKDCFGDGSYENFGIGSED